MSINMRSGPEAELDESKLTKSEIAIPFDGTPRICLKPGVVKKLLTSEDAGDIIALSEKVSAQSDSLEDLIITKTNVNDATANLTQSWSGSKTQSEINELNTNLLSKVSQTELEVERNRITNLATLSAGSTTGDAELIDSRIGANAIAYPSSGQAHRASDKRTIKHSDIFLNANGVVGDIIPYEAISTTLNIADTNLINTTPANTSLFSNGIVVDDNVKLKGITINSPSCTSVGVGIARGVGTANATWLGFWSTLAVTNNYVDFSVVNLNIRDMILKAGDIVFVRFNNGNIKYSANTSNAYKALTNYNSSSITPITVSYLVGFNIDYETLTFEFNYPNSIPAGKTWLGAGDSITNGDTNSNISYTKYVSEYLGITCDKQGFSGYSMQALYQLLASFSNTSDIVTIFAGTNDFNENRPLGTSSDMGTTSFWGTLNNFMPALQNKYTTKPIIFFTPIQRNYSGVAEGVYTGMTNGNGWTLAQYVQIIKDAGVKYGIPVVDLYSISGFGSTTSIPYYTNDGVHPNDIGHHRLASLIASEIKRYMSI